MAETDVLNPVQGYWAQINDNPNPSYGFTRKTNANAQLARARMGSWYQRDNANDGYSFALSYMNRPWTTMLRLKQFYEIGKSGYFTIIDYDGGGRHHVGRFTTEPNPTQVANGKYNIQNLIFEEIPQARMLTYPSDFINWTRTLNVVDDFLNCSVAYQGAWQLQSPEPYTGPLAIGPKPPPTPGIPLVVVPSNYQLVATGPAAAGDFAQVQYVGFGFEINFPLNAAYGTWDLLVDGQTVVTSLNLTTGGATTLTGYTPVNSPVALLPPTLTVNLVDATYSTVTVQLSQMPLDIHRVKMVRNQTMVFDQPDVVIGTPPLYGVGPSPPRGGQFLDLGNLPIAFPGITVIV